MKTDMNDNNCTIGTMYPRKKTEEEAKRDCGQAILESQGYKPAKKKLWPWVVITAIVALSLLKGCVAHAETGMASWFSNVETGGKNCADGYYHDLNTELVIASWRMPLGSYVRITTMDGRSVVARVCDRGPGRKDGTSRYYKGKRIADLSKAVFEKLSPSGTTTEGIIKVSVEKIKGE